MYEENTDEDHEETVICDQGYDSVSDSQNSIDNVVQPLKTQPPNQKMNASEGADCYAAESQNEVALTLTDMPYEILIHISTYLDPRVIISSLCQVCRSFYDIFSEDRYWRTRIGLQCQKPYPIVEREDFNWQKACMEREEINRQWTNPEEHFNHFMFRDGFFASVDVVHIFKGGQYLAVGSRDRHMNVLDLTKFDHDTPEQRKEAVVFSDDKQHKGWVWSMATHASDENTLVTGSWDAFVRLWDVGDGAIRLNTNIRLKSAVLGVHYEPGFIAVGGFDKRLCMFDPREPDAPSNMTIKRYHDKPILSVVADDKYVITGGEDKAYSIYDRRAGKKLKRIPLDSFVLDMSYADGQLWGGNSDGKLYVLDTTDGLFDEQKLQTIDVGHTGKVTGVHHTDGGIFTCSTDGTVKIVEPTLEPRIINTLSDHTQAVARVSYNNGVLVSAGTDISVGLWIPKNRTF